MLLNDFYTIETAGVEPHAAGTRAVLALNAAHPIFAGHFPGQPVVPGACQLQIVQELLSHALGGEYRLLEANQLKFLTPIDPRQHPRIEATLRYAAPHAEAPGEGLHVTATLSAGDTIFLKFTGTFRAG
jgi:3-hydroxyacyl-[acyl-carrier-protein] dehydratase